MAAFPYDTPIYVGTLGVDQVDEYLKDNPWPFNATDDGAIGTTNGKPHPDGVGVGPWYPVPFINGTNRDQPDPDNWSPVYFIVYSQTWRVEVHGAFTGVLETQPVFQVPALIAPGVRIPMHGTAVDFLGGWRGYMDVDGTIYYMQSF